MLTVLNTYSKPSEQAPVLKASTSQVSLLGTTLQSLAGLELPALGFCSTACSLGLNQAVRLPFGLVILLHSVDFSGIFSLQESVAQPFLSW